MPDSNRITYGGQGTADSVDSLSNDFSKLDASSLEARDPKHVIVAPPNLELLDKLHERLTTEELARQRTEKYLDESIDDAPWLYFLERSMTSDATETSGCFFPMDLDGSMENNAVSTGTRSMLSSYMSAISVRSDAASAIVKHTGAGLVNVRPAGGNQRNPFLKLL
jgi:hypothetical protein